MGTTVAELKFPLSWNPTIPEIEQQANEYPWSTANLHSCFGEAYLNWGLFEHQQLCGYVLCHCVADELTIMNIVVAPRVQRRGLGSMMLREVLARAAQEEWTVWLEVRESNAAAIALYQQFGFEQTGLRKDYYPTKSGHEAAIVMRWSADCTSD